MDSWQLMNEQVIFAAVVDIEGGTGDIGAVYDFLNGNCIVSTFIDEVEQCLI